MVNIVMVLPLIAGFSGSLGASAALMGLVGGVANLCALFCRPWMGNLADKISKYKVSSAGAIAMAVASVGYLIATKPWMVLLARVFTGIGFACCSVCMSTWMSNLLPRTKIGMGMGLYGTVNAVAMALGPAVGVAVYQAAGYRPVFILAFASAVIMLVLMQFIQDKGEPAAAASDKAEAKPKLQMVDINVVPIALIIMLFAIPYFANQSFLVNYAEARNLSITVSLFFPVYAAFLVVLRLGLSKQFDTLPFKTFLIGSSASALVGIVLLTIMKGNLAMFLAAGCMAAGYGLMCSVCQSHAILLAGKEKRGLANSTYYIGLDLGMSFGPVIGGVLYGHLDLALYYPVFLLSIPCIWLVYLIASKKVEM